MKLGVLFSGGKDSCLALQKAKEKDEVVCLITVISENPESFMFHTPNIFLTKLQAEAMELPIVSITTRGEKEKELEELEKVIRRAKEEHGIEGIVTGAIKSEYQKSRIEKVCRELCLECINPLWHRDEINIMKELVENDFEVIITGVFAEPFGREWLGRKIDFVTIDELEKLERAYKINPSGEGGEIETTVLDAPFFKKRIEIEKSSVSFSRDSGTLKIEKASLMKK